MKSSLHCPHPAHVRVPTDKPASPPSQVPYGAVFNFELDPPATVAVSGVQLVTLGQELPLHPGGGATEESNKMYGWGWRRQPARRTRLLAQARRMLRGERNGGHSMASGVPVHMAPQKPQQRQHVVGGSKGRAADAATAQHGAGSRLCTRLLVFGGDGAKKQRRRLVEAVFLEVSMALIL